MDGSRRGIRLLKTLKEDSETMLTSIKSFHLTALVHSIENNLLNYAPGKDISIAQEVSKQMKMILDNAEYRKSIKSPNGIENPLAEDNLMQDIKSLKLDLDTLIQDTAKDILKNEALKKAILNY